MIKWIKEFKMVEIYTIVKTILERVLLLAVVLVICMLLYSGIQYISIWSYHDIQDVAVTIGVIISVIAIITSIFQQLLVAVIRPPLIKIEHLEFLPHFTTEMRPGLKDVSPLISKRRYQVNNKLVNTRPYQAALNTTIVIDKIEYINVQNKWDAIDLFGDVSLMYTPANSDNFIKNIPHYAFFDMVYVVEDKDLVFMPAVNPYLHLERECIKVEKEHIILNSNKKYKVHLSIYSDNSAKARKYIVDIEYDGIFENDLDKMKKHLKVKAIKV
jgi:hypothetical protein